MSPPIIPSIKRVINEGGTILLDLSHRNESGVLTAPTSLSYRIDDLTNVRQILDWTAIPTPATKNTITITQTTLEDREEDYEVRQVTTRAVDSLGNPDQAVFLYKILRVFTEAGYLFP